METEPPVCSAQSKRLGENLGETNAQDDEVLGEILGELNSAVGQEHGVGSRKHSKPKTSKQKLHNVFSSEGTLIRKERRESDSERLMEVSMKLKDPQPKEDSAKRGAWQPAGTDIELAFTGDSLPADEHSFHVHPLKQVGTQSSGIADTAEHVNSEEGLKVKVTATRAAEQRLDLPADAEEELAGSFGQMSPFKTTTSR